MLPGRSTMKSAFRVTTIVAVYVLIGIGAVSAETLSTHRTLPPAGRDHFVAASAASRTGMCGSFASGAIESSPLARSASASVSLRNV